MPTKSVSSPPSRAEERVMVFIDGSNLYHVLSQHCARHDLEFGKFSEKLANGRYLRRTYYYNIKQESEKNPDAGADQDRFLRALYETPYMDVRLGIWKLRGESMVEKGVDVMIAIDLLRKAYQDLYDTAILVSGDGDFYPAIEAVKDLGKHVEVAAFGSNISPEAERAADLHIRFTKTYFTSLWMSRRQKGTVALSETREEVNDEASSPEGENKPARSRTSLSARSRSRSRPAKPAQPAQPAQSAQPARTDTREPDSVRTQTSRTRTSSGPEPSTPAAGSPAPETRESRPGIRRTPVRRRVGGSSRPPASNGNNPDGDAPDRPAAAPAPPVLKKRTPQPDRANGASGKPAPASGDPGSGKPAAGEAEDARRGRWLKRLGLGSSDT